MPACADDIASSQPTPHLSVVAVSRNDDHGGDMLGRMQHFVNGLIAQCRRHHLAAELILVEWNPLPDRPSLEDALRWPTDFGPLLVRIVTVPAEVHARFAHSTELPLFQMIGKNVGIRRARGQYVLATNVDILFDDNLVRYLRDMLKPKIMLRVDRYDVPADLPKGAPIERVLADCRRRFFQVCTRFGMLNVRRMRILGGGSGLVAYYLTAFHGIRILKASFGQDSRFYLTGNSIGWWAKIADSVVATFYSIVCSVWIGVKVAARVAMNVVLDVISLAGVALRKLWPPSEIPVNAYRFGRRVAKRCYLTGWRIVRIARELKHILASKLGFARQFKLLKSESEAERRFRRSRWLHTNACGDFTLLTRDDWFRLRGYPEWPIFSWHIDSILLFAANAQDIGEVALGAKYRIFHIDHSVGSGWSPEGAAQLFARLEDKGIPYLSDDDVLRFQKEFAEEPAAAIVNDENWGIIEFPLPEREISPQGQTARTGSA